VTAAWIGSALVISTSQALRASSSGNKFRKVLLRNEAGRLSFGDSIKDAGLGGNQLPSTRARNVGSFGQLAGFAVANRRFLSVAAASLAPSAARRDLGVDILDTPVDSVTARTRRGLPLFSASVSGIATKESNSDSLQCRCVGAASVAHRDAIVRISVDAVRISLST
jgi:hypothetical protein